MARIFLSHSSKNNAEAVALRDWLIGEGWDDLFLDLDPERGIVAGEKWERALSEAANRCEAVLFLISRAWLASHWCLRELHLALKLNKRVFGILIEEIPKTDLPTELTGAWQVVELAAGADHSLYRAELPDGAEVHVTFSGSGLKKLKAGLTKAGLDPRFFPWPPESDPDRPPYRGLRPLEAEDAGIFFGREAPTIEALDRLRGLSEAAPPRVFVILGASGAGKSSFLRAGLLPRLQRDDRHFLPLPIVRPERAALSGEIGFLRCLEVALKRVGLRRARTEVKRVVQSGASPVRALLDEIAEHACPPALADEEWTAPPRLVLPIDQGEELFLSEGRDEAQAFLALARELASEPGSNLIVLFTIRSDSFEYLQTAPALEGIHTQTFSLPPLPKGAYQTVIEGPAERLRDTPRALQVEPSLTEALLADIETGGAKDALPLLAFTLERLYLEHGGDDDLRLAEYEAIGRIQGSIEAAVDHALKAADDDPAVPKDRNTRLTLLRRALIPWLAGIDPETGAPRRRIARLSEIPEEARPLLNHLIAARLLATDVSPESGEKIIEPAHEALLRQWGLLQGWLEEDFSALTTLEGIKRATRDWEANGKDEAWLAHSAGRLEDAEVLKSREDLARFLEASDRSYLAACRSADNARRNRELEEARKLAEAQGKVVRRTRIGLIAASLLALLAIGAAVFGFYQAEIAGAKSAEAVRNETVGIAALARVALADGYPVEAVKLALVAWPRTGAMDRSTLQRSVESLAAVLPSQRERLRLKGHEGEVYSAAFSPDGGRVVTASSDNTARLWEATTGAELIVLRGHEGEVYSAIFSPDGSRVVTASSDNTARLWEAATGAELAVLRGHEAEIYSAVFSPDGDRVLTASKDHTARLWDAATGAKLAVLRGHEEDVNSAVFSPDGSRVLTASSDNSARLWDAASGAELAVLRGHEDMFLFEGVISAVFSPDGSRVVTASWDKTARLWDAATGAELAVLRGHEEAVLSAVFSPDGSRVVTASWDDTARLWDAATGAELAVLRGHVKAVRSAVFSADGNYVVTASEDLTARLWEAVTGAELAVLRGHEVEVTSAVFSPDGGRVVTASKDHTARLWEAATGAKLAVLRVHEGYVYSAFFSSDGGRVATVSTDHAARLWDTATGAKLAVLRGHEKDVNFAVFSPDGSRVLTASKDHTARLWDAATGAELAVLRGHEAEVNSAVFSPGGNYVVTASKDHTARLWDAATGAKLAVLRGHEEDVNSADFSPDGDRVLTTSMDHAARLWDAATGAKLAVLRGHQKAVRSADFSPDGSRVLTASWGNTARLWEAASGAELAVLREHEEAVRSAVFFARRQPRADGIQGPHRAAVGRCHGCQVGGLARTRGRSQFRRFFARRRPRSDGIQGPHRAAVGCCHGCQAGSTARTRGRSQFRRFFARR